MANTLTTLDAALKQLYRAKNLGDATYKRRPMFAAMPKFEGFGGRNMPVPVKYGQGVGGSGSVFATAQANVSAVLYEDFLLTGINLYHVTQFTGESLDYSTNDAMAFVRGLKTKVDSAFGALSDAIESYLPRTGSGSLGTIGSMSTTTLTLADTDDVQVFEVGMELVHGTPTDGDTIGSSAAENTVTAVDRTAGTLTSDAAWTTTWSDPAIATDHIYVGGTAQNGTSNALPTIAGFGAWISSAGDSSFFGVDTTVDDRLSGNWHDGSAQLVEEALIDGASVAAAEGGAPDVCFIHPTSHRKLVKEVGSRTTYDKLMAKGPKGEMANIAFRGLVLDGPLGPVKVISANKCQSTRGWMLDSETWSLNSNGSAPKIISNDGLRIRAGASADNFECRLVFRGNLSCNAPGHNTGIVLA